MFEFVYKNQRQYVNILYVKFKLEQWYRFTILKLHYMYTGVKQIHIWMGDGSQVSRWWKVEGSEEEEQERLEWNNVSGIRVRHMSMNAYSA